MRRKFRPTPTRPKDFFSFWQKTLDDLEGVPVDLRREPVEATGRSDVVLESLSFSSLWGKRVHGYFLRPKHGRNGPLVVHAHGYGSCCTVQWEWGSADLNVIGIDIRGFGLSEQAVSEPSRWGYVLTGIGAPETCVLRGAVCDFVRAAQVGQSLLEPGRPRTVLYGRSFGGALALMAEGVAHLADFLALGVPSFGWAEGRHFFVRDGSGQQINAYLRAYPDHTEDVMLVLRYFDSIHFAGHVTCPVLLGIGLEDEVVPANTVYAIANHLAGPVEIMEFPVSHSERPEEKLWEAFEARWQQLVTANLAIESRQSPGTLPPA